MMETDWEARPGEMQSVIETVGRLRIDSVVTKLIHVRAKGHEDVERCERIGSDRKDYRREGENRSPTGVDRVRHYGKAVIRGANGGDWGKGGAVARPVNETLVEIHGLVEQEITDLDRPEGFQIPCESPARSVGAPDEVELDPLGIGTVRGNR